MSISFSRKPFELCHENRLEHIAKFKDISVAIRLLTNAMLRVERKLEFHLAYGGSLVLCNSRRMTTRSGHIEG